jgi:hypothetical protein
MLLPTVAFALGMTWELMPARWLGMLGLISFYQMAYGTVIYFFQYVFNGRYHRSPRALVYGIVVPGASHLVHVHRALQHVHPLASLPTHLITRTRAQAH